MAKPAKRVFFVRQRRAARAGFAHFAQRSYANTKSTQKKGDPQSGSPPLRCGATCGARAKRGPAKLASLKQRRPLSACLCAPRPSQDGAIGSGDRRQIPKKNQYKQGHAMACPCCFRYWYFFSHPLWMRRGAQGQTDQGWRCLSEASLARPRLDRASQVARSEAEGRSNQGRLSFGYFSLAKQRKVPRPPGRDPASRTKKRKEEEERARPEQDPA